MSVLASSINKAPRKLAPLHQYLKLHYISKIKPEFVRRYAVAKDAWQKATEDEKKNGVVMKPVAVKMRLELAREFWLLETEEFREAVSNNASAAHAEEMEQWQSAKTIPKTPQEFHQ